jgi:hypothetical protein
MRVVLVQWASEALVLSLSSAHVRNMSSKIAKESFHKI